MYLNFYDKNTKPQNILTALFSIGSTVSHEEKDSNLALTQIG